MNKIYSLISYYLFDVRIIILDTTNYYKNNIKQIMSNRGYDITSDV